MAKKSEDRRRSILNAALDEFEAKGFSAALVEDIAHRAGVSKGTIYGYFKGKEALNDDWQVRFVLESGFSADSERLSSMVMCSPAFKNACSRIRVCSVS